MSTYVAPDQLDDDLVLVVETDTHTYRFTTTDEEIVRATLDFVAAHNNGTPNLEPELAFLLRHLSRRQESLLITDKETGHTDAADTVDADNIVAQMTQITARLG